MIELEQTYYKLPDVMLHVTSAGDKAGETILFLHGFPEYGASWKKQLTFFAGQGYYAVAPDQRGYNRSSKPTAVADYTVEKLARDIIELIRQLGKEKVVLVGHDWGGIVAWTVAMYFPYLLHRLVILNIPHPRVLGEHLRHNPKQMLRSWYTAAFQIPVLPELVAQVSGYKLLTQAMAGTAKPGAFSEEELAAYRENWQQPGALAGMLNWYRAFKYSELNLDKKVEVPTLMIWGKKDFGLGSEMAQPSIASCTNGKLIFLEEATHWLHHDYPDRVNQEILSFLHES